MIGLRHRWLKDRLKAEAEALWTALQAYEETNSRIVCSNVVTGATVAAGSAVSGGAGLDRLWGLRGDNDKARRLIEEFSFEMLSMWLWGNKAASRERSLVRGAMLEVLLTVFDDLTVETRRRFERRDVQRRFELSTEPAEGFTHMVGAMLLLSDAAIALGGQPLYPVPIDGYPFENVPLFLEMVKPELDEIQLGRGYDFRVGDHLQIGVACSAGAEVMLRSFQRWGGGDG